MNQMIKTYSELTTFDTFEERFNYLKLDGVIGESTFGFDRFINQKFYKTPQWKHCRDLVIVRDNGCDLGITDRLITGRILIHHLNPITIDDILNNKSIAIDPEFMIATSHNTHNAIHYSDDNILIKDYKERTKNDTKLW